MKSLQEILNTAKYLPNKCVAVVCPENIEVMLAIKEAIELNLCDFQLYGNETLIENAIESIENFPTKGVTIHHAPTPELACQAAVKAVSSKKANVLMKGLVSTAILMKAVLNKEFGLRDDTILSHVMVMELPHFDRLIFLSDGAITIDPTIDQLRQITQNAVSLAHKLGINRPKVALLSAVEQVNPKMPSTLKAEAIQNMYEQGELVRCVISGPLALDLAISKEAAKTKDMKDEVSGQADILIAPYIEVANTLYKGWMFGVEGVNSAAVVTGAKAPIILTSRADKHEAKLYSIALSVLL